MERRYPNNIIIKDIGSGLNYKRKGLQEIIMMAINGEIEELKGDKIFIGKTFKFN